MPIPSEQLDIAPGDHVVQFYDHSQELVDSVGGYLLSALRADGVAVVVGTPAHRRGLQSWLAARGVDVAAAARRGTLVLLDARRTLGSFLEDGSPDPVGFDSVVGAVIRRAAETGGPVHAYGEMVAILWEAGRVEAALELEGLWNGLQTEVPFSLFCAYRSATVGDRRHSSNLKEICRLHSRVVGGTPPVPAPDGDALHVSGHFPARPESPREARRLVIEALQACWDAELVSDAAIVVSELATNAVVHAGSDFGVDLESSAGSVRISVRDGSGRLPASSPASASSPGPRTDLQPDRLAPSGRGLGLVGSLARRWGCETTPDGKRVWAELAPG